MEKGYDRLLTEYDSGPGGIRDILIILFKHKYSIVTIFFLIVTAVTVVTLMLTPVYEASSSILVKFGREYIYRPGSGGSKPAVALQSFNREEAVRSEMEILTSKGLLEKVIETIGVNALYPDLAGGRLGRISPLQAAMLELEKDISVKNLEKSNVIEVSIRNEDPKIAARAVNLLVELFKEKHLEVLSSPKSSFLEKQVKEYELKLLDSANRLEAFKQEHGIFSLGEQRSLLLKQRVDLDSSLKRDQNRMRELEQVTASSGAGPVTVRTEAAYRKEAEQYRMLQDARSRLLALKLEEQELLGKYKEGNRLVVNIRKELGVVKDFIEEQGRSYADAEMNSLKARTALVREQIRQQDDEIRKIDMREKELQILKRELAVNEKNFEVYRGRYEEARISEDMDRQNIANISVIQEAVEPIKPLKPRIVLNIVLGIILADLIAIGFAFMAEYFSQVLSTPERAERRLKIPVLTTISYKD